jgi:electron transport complex protein RnfC
MIRLEEHKELTQRQPIETAPVPAQVIIPLLQHLGKPCDLLKVNVGDHVFRGQLLATSETGVFASIHASISGTVKAIEDRPHPLSGFCRSIVIDTDGKDEAFGGLVPRSPEEVDKINRDDLRRIVFDAGIVGLGGATFPTHIKLNPSKPIDTFIVNGAECEPYLTADDRLMVECPDEITKGIKLVEKILRPRQCAIAIEDNKPAAIEAMRERARMFNWDVVVLKTAYPQGGEKQVIKSCVGREVPSGGLPFDVGVVVLNVGTLNAIYEAVYLNKPLYERVMTVSGPCVRQPKNLLVRLGTPVKDLAAACGGFVKEPRKIVMGGPMMGVAQFTMEGPVIKGTSGVLFFDEVEERVQDESFCIRCGECVENCPVGLSPTMIAQAIAKEKFDLAEELGIMDCIECGLCAYLCPARRGIVEAIKIAKARIRRGKK